MLEVVVSAGDDVEVRRLSLTNRSDRMREIDITSYAEIVLGRLEDDIAHPAFGKLFVQTEYLPESTAIICGRRPRSQHEPRAWVVPRPEPRWRPGVADRVGDQPGAVHRARPHDGLADRARRPFADRHHRLGARSGREPAPACAPRARRICQDGVLHRRCRDARGGGDARAALPRSRRRVARGDDGLHAQPDAAPASRHLERAGSPVRPAGEPCPVPGRVVAGHARAAGRGDAGAVRAVGARHLRRPADPARDRRGG